MKLTTAIRQPKLVVFLKEVKTELAKVAWPKKKQAIRLTLIVVGVSVTMALFLGSLDFLFTKLVSLIVSQ